MNKEYMFNRIPKNVPKIETKHRKICTRLPVPESLPIIERSIKYEPWSMNHQLYAVWDRAVDYQIFDKWGNIWIDFSSGIFVTNCGHGNPDLVKAIKQMIDKPMLSSYYYPSEIRSLLAEQIIKMSPDNMDKVFFLTTGSETTECALKLCRIYGMKSGRKKTGIITFYGGFHGKTLGAQTMSGRPEAQKWIGKTDPFIYHLECPADAFADMDQIYDEDRGRKLFERDIKKLEKQGVDLNSIAGAVFEPYQGWAALFYPVGYIKALREFLYERDALLVADEVQAGFGRTGRLFGFENYGVSVDIICCGKGISGALPLSAVISRKEIIDVDGSLNSTHGGSPIPCATALANLRYIEKEHLVEEAKRKEKILKRKFLRMKEMFPDRIRSIHGMGMAFAAVFTVPGTDILDVEFVDRIIERAYEKGLMSIRTMTGTLKVGPPLTIPDEALEEGMDILTESTREIAEETGNRG